VGPWGRSFVSIALMLFAFTSIMYNYYLGENSLNFFSEENRTLFNVYRTITLVLVMWGATQDLTTVFGFADLTMALLGLVNLTALALLFKVGLRVMRDFDQQMKAGHAPVFDANRFADLNIDRRAWISEDVAPAAPATARQTTIT
jgi:AGCS family alanine or glycine:cation symporter